MSRRGWTPAGTVFFWECLLPFSWSLPSLHHCGRSLCYRSYWKLWTFLNMRGTVLLCAYQPKGITDGIICWFFEQLEYMCIYVVSITSSCNPPFRRIASFGQCNLSICISWKIAWRWMVGWLGGALQRAHKMKGLRFDISLAT